MSDTVTKPVVNVELLDKALTAIEREPGRWNQGAYIGSSGRARVPVGPVDICQTVCCLAGHAMIESGKYIPVMTADRGMALAVAETGKELPHGYQRAAAELLGLTEEQASYLFYADWDAGIADPRKHVYNYLGLEIS